MFKEVELWEAILATSIAALVIFGITLLSAYTFSTKKFNGYYLRHHGMEHKIYINWDNAPDETAFSSYDPNEILRVFEKLNKGEK